MSESGSLEALAEAYLVVPKVAPAACLGLGTRSSSGWKVSIGAAGRLDRGPSASVTPETLFDLASVTKPIVATAFARLAARGAMDPGSELGAHLPEARGTPSERVPLELLLCHRAGLDAHRALFEPLFSGAPFERSRALRTACSARRPECSGAPSEAGFPPVYSDLGYLLLGESMSRSSGLALDELVLREVGEPLALAIGSARQWLAREVGFMARVAPTEIVVARGGPLRGVVHDENAWAIAGHGIAGHAGLFGSAEGVVRFGCAVLGALGGTEGWLSAAELAPLVRARPGGTLRAGFDGVSASGSSAGTRQGPRAFGHLGFTGTSLWCDPDADLVSVILTNRVHPSRDHLAIRAARPPLQDALFALGTADSTLT